MPVLTLYQKSILASVLLAIAFAQLLVMSISRGWIGGFSPKVRRRTLQFHRFEGYIGLLIILWVAFNCIYYIGVRTGSLRVVMHGLLGATVIGLLSAKILIAHGLTQFYRRLPLLGVALFAAVIGLWVVSAGWFFTQ